MAWLLQGENRFGATHERDGRTDGQTDRHRVTAIAALCIATHGKNGFQLLQCAWNHKWTYNKCTHEHCQRTECMYVDFTIFHNAWLKHYYYIYIPFTNCKWNQFTRQCGDLLPMQLTNSQLLEPNILRILSTKIVEIVIFDKVIQQNEKAAFWDAVQKKVYVGRYSRVQHPTQHIIGHFGDDFMDHMIQPTA